MYNQEKRESGAGTMAQEKLTIKQVARELDVDERTVRRWIKSGQLKYSGYDIRGRYLVSRIDLDKFVREKTGRREEDE